MPDPAKLTSKEVEAMRRRAIVLRRYVSQDNQAAFARKLGITPNRWNNFERGYPLNMDMLFRLVKAIPGLSTGYIAHGLTGDMPAALIRRLSEIEMGLFGRVKADGR